MFDTNKLRDQCKRDKLLAYCISYIAMINLGVAGDYNRALIHQKIEDVCDWIEPEQLKEYLHNLDSLIGLPLRTLSNEEVRIYGVKLFRFLESKLNERNIDK